MTQTKVTVIGLGLMGSALARTLSAAGLEVTVWNRSPAKTQSLESEMVATADTIIEAIQASTIIIVCVRDYDATNELLRVDTVEVELAGKVIIQLSTGTPSQACEASAWATSIDATYLDGAIVAFPDAIGTESCAILYAGDTTVFESCRTVIDAFGGNAQLVGANPGSAAALDNAFLSIYFSFLFGALNGAAICDAENVPLPLFRELGTSLLPVFGGVLSRSVDMITADTYESERSTLDTSASALAKLAEAGQGAGLDGRFIECMRTYTEEALEAGYGSVGNAVLFKQFRKQ